MDFRIIHDRWGSVCEVFTSSSFKFLVSHNTDIPFYVFPLLLFHLSRYLLKQLTSDINNSEGDQMSFTSVVSKGLYSAREGFPDYSRSSQCCFLNQNIEVINNRNDDLLQPNKKRRESGEQMSH